MPEDKEEDEEEEDEGEKEEATRINSSNVM